MRAAIWRNTIVVAVIYIVAIAAVDHLLLARFITGRAMALALAFSIVQTVAILLMLATLWARKQRNVIRLARSRRLVPQIQEALAQHAIGFDQMARLEQLRRQSANDVRETLFAALNSMRGQPRERVAEAAAHLGFVERGGEEAAEWARNLIRLGHADQFDRIVAWVARQNLLTRAVAAEELETYAAKISEAQIGEALQSPDPEVVLVTLDMLRAWRRAWHIPGFARLLLHEDSRVRTRALLVLPYAAAGASPESIAPAMIASLTHQSAETRAAAAVAAGRMGITSAVDALGARLVDPEHDVAIAAAFALVSLGQRGNELLQRALLSPERAGAAVAFEALEKAALGRTEMS
jgi:HEAT repeat protein